MYHIVYEYMCEKYAWDTPVYQQWILYFDVWIVEVRNACYRG